MNNKIVKCCERIGEYKARNPNTLMCIDGIYMTPTEWGSDMDATYRLLGMCFSKCSDNLEDYTTFDILDEFEEYISMYIPSLFVPIRDYVTAKVTFPKGYEDAEKSKILENIIGRLTKSVACGATMLQNDRFIEKMQKAIDTHSFWDRKN